MLPDRITLSGFQSSFLLGSQHDVAPEYKLSSKGHEFSPLSSLGLISVSESNSVGVPCSLHCMANKVRRRSSVRQGGQLG